MNHFLIFGFCCNCDKTRDLDKHGRCVNCGSDSVVRRSYEVPPQSVIEDLMQLEKMFRLFVIENPRAKLRKLPLVQRLERRTVTYCQYGERRMKPTDLWGGFPPSLVLKPACNNGMPCHDAAPRGSRTGTQGMDSAESAKIPRELALAVCLACETDLMSGAKSVTPPQVEQLEQAGLFDR